MRDRPRRPISPSRPRSIAVAIVLGLASPAVAQPPLRVTTVGGDLPGAVGGVSVDVLGMIYVADFGEQVWKVSPWGEIEVLTDAMYAASGNTVDHQGYLVQSSFRSNLLTRIARDGSAETLATGLAGPVGVIEGEPGTFYVCNCQSNTIARIGPDRVPRVFAESDLLNCPNGITKDGDGTLFVVNFSDGRMLRIDQHGGVSLFATIPGGGNGHLTWVGPEFYVAGFRANRIFRVDQDGTVGVAAGSGRFGEADGVGEEAMFSSPNGIAFDRARDWLYVNDAMLPWAERFENRSRPTSRLRRIALPTLREIADDAFAGTDPAAVKGRIRAYQATHPGRPYEPVLTNLGYAYLGSGRIDEAVTIFELITELFPQSFNAWDSLGEGHLAAGDREAAVRFYRKSLELEPTNANAVEKLREIGAD